MPPWRHRLRLGQMLLMSRCRDCVLEIHLQILETAQWTLQVVLWMREQVLRLEPWVANRRLDVARAGLRGS